MDNVKTLYSNTQVLIIFKKIYNVRIGLDDVKQSEFSSPFEI